MAKKNGKLGTKDHNLEVEVFDGDDDIATAEVERYLAKDGPEGVNLETGWTTKTKGTRHFNKA